MQGFIQLLLSQARVFEHSLSDLHPTSTMGSENILIISLFFNKKSLFIYLPILTHSSSPLPVNPLIQEQVIVLKGSVS